MLKTLSAKTCYIETRLVYFRPIHNRVMTNKILFKMKLIDSSKCLSCDIEDTVVHAFLECKNVRRLSRSFQYWIRN